MSPFISSPLSIFRLFGRFLGKLWQPLSIESSSAQRPLRAQNEYGELVSLVLMVCTAIFVIKATIAYRDLNKADIPPQIYNEEILLSLGRVTACCFEDFAVGAALLFGALLTIRLGRSLWYRRGVRFVCHVIAAGAIGYMVVNAQIFHYLRRFLTISLFEMGGGFHPERSISESATLPFKFAVGIMPLAALSVHLVIVARFPGFWNQVARWVCRPVVLMLMIGLLTGGALGAQFGLFPGTNNDFAQNPHLLFARSFFWDMSFGDLDSRTGDLADFQTGDPRPGCKLGKRPKNIILIVLESAGANYFQTYGFKLPTTPCLNRLKDKSVTFENLYATSNKTIASALPLFGATHNDPHTFATVVDYPGFPVPGVQHLLKKEGYKTYFLSSGGLTTWEGYRNLAQAFTSKGFDAARDPLQSFWQGHKDPKAFLDDSYMDESMFADARRVLEDAKGEKFFLMMWNYDTHLPYYAESGPDFDPDLFPFAATSDLESIADFKRFLWSIHQTDKLIGRLYKELEMRGLAEDTLVVVTGDHGEAFGQHGTFVHGDSLFDEEIKVPLIMIHPGLAKLGTRKETIGTHVDVWPTIADICGLATNPLWQGRSLLGTLPDTQRRAYFYRRGSLGVREGRFKYIWDYEFRMELLFDVTADPEEHLNLAARYPELCRELRRRLRDWVNFQARLTHERLTTDTSRN